eukprot:360988-Chlamydomonas_euryale.AAC.8
MFCRAYYPSRISTQWSIEQLVNSFVRCIFQGAPPELVAVRAAWERSDRVLRALGPLSKTPFSRQRRVSARPSTASGRSQIPQNRSTVPGSARDMLWDAMVRPADMSATICPCGTTTVTRGTARSAPTPSSLPYTQNLKPIPLAPGHAEPEPCVPSKITSLFHGTAESKPWSPHRAAPASAHGCLQFNAGLHQKRG